MFQNNSYVMVGSIVGKTDVKETENSKYCRFTIRCADISGRISYPSFLSFGKVAAAVGNLKKGEIVKVRFKVITSKFDNKEGKTVYSQDLVADSIDIFEEKDVIGF